MENRKKMLEFNFTNEENFFIRGNLISQMKGKNIFRGNLISRMKDQFTKFTKFSSREIFPINHKCHKPTLSSLVSIGLMKLEI